MNNIQKNHKKASLIRLNANIESNVDHRASTQEVPENLEYLQKVVIEARLDPNILLDPVVINVFANLRLHHTITYETLIQQLYGTPGLGHFKQEVKKGAGKQLCAELARKRPDNPHNNPEIIIGTDEHRVTKEVIEALIPTQELFVRNGRLVHIVSENTAKTNKLVRRNGLTIAELNPNRLRELITNRVQLLQKVKRSEQGISYESLELAHPPLWLVGQIAERKDWYNMPYLSAVTRIPFMRHDGTLCMQRGYDPKTGVFCDISDELEDIPNIPENPTQTDVDNAVTLLHDVVCDFPFKDNNHRAAWLAAVLTPFARNAFDGPVPFFLIDANTPGTGKTKLNGTVPQIAIGQPAATVDYSDNNEEMNKALMAIALSGDPVVSIDNIATTLGCSALDRALTSTVIAGRQLGKNDASAWLKAEIQTLFTGTGNNVQLRGDMGRRTMLCRLESPDEFPQERQGFRHDNLEEHIRENRSALVDAALTILRAYVIAGKPPCNLKPWGSFEGWSALVRNAVYWATGYDPAATRADLLRDSDTTRQTLTDFLEGLEEYQNAKCLHDGFTAKQIISDLTSEMYVSKFARLRDAIDEYCPVAKGQRLTTARLSGVLRKFKDRIVQGKSLKAERDATNTTRWLILAK